MPATTSRPRAEALLAAKSPSEEALERLGVDALELAIGFGLVPHVDGSSGGSLVRACQHDPPTARRRARDRDPGGAHPR